MISKRNSIAGLLGRLVGFMALVGVTALVAQQKSPVAKAEKVKGSPKVEFFQNRPLRRWSTVAGNWQAREIVEVANVDRRAIYRSPEEPSHVAWVGIWKAADGSISIRFPQITGNLGLEPSYAPWYGRATFADYGLKSWPEFAASGSMKVGPPDALTTTRVHYITMVTRDNGNTWRTVSIVPSNTTDARAEARGYNSRLVLAPNGKLVGQGMATLLCRDGRIVDTVSASEYFKESRAGKRYLLGLRESLDNGKTWKPVQWISGKYEDGKPVEQASEEHSFVELDDGRLLFIIRSDELQHPLAAWLTRHPDGQYTCDAPVVITPMPHAGMPNLVRTSDGTIWYWGARHYYSLDDGKTWQGLPDSQAFPAYYGKMQAAGNQLLCITQKDIGDSPYPHLHDASIEQIRFSGRRLGVMQQTDPGASPALLKLEGAAVRRSPPACRCPARESGGVGFPHLPRRQIVLRLYGGDARHRSAKTLGAAAGTRLHAQRVFPWPARRTRAGADRERHLQNHAASHRGSCADGQRSIDSSAWLQCGRREIRDLGTIAGQGAR